MADEKTGEDTSGKGQGDDAGKSGAGYGDQGGDVKQKGETEGTGDQKS